MYMELKEKIVDLQTGEIIWRDYTPEEIAEVKVYKAKIEEEKKLAEEKRLARQAILNRLGITEEEAKLLLGGN